VGIQPAFAVTSNSIGSDDDCNLCPKVSDLHIDRLRNLISRLDKRNNELSKLSEYNPKITDIYTKISNKITFLRDMNNKLNSITDFEDNPFLCIFLVAVIVVPLLIEPFFMIFAPLLIVFPWLVFIVLPIAELQYRLLIKIFDFIDEECSIWYDLLITKMKHIDYGVMNYD
jgi:hypothetical protein